MSTSAAANATAQGPAGHTKNLNTAAANTRFRHRKISVKQQLHIYKPSDLKNLDAEELQQRDVIDVETGVEKNEEKEVHLHKILQKKQVTTAKKDYIPTPDASHIWKGFEQFYQGKYNFPKTYIKFSATVEDCFGANYFMDEIDEKFLNEKVNLNINDDDKDKFLTEDEFELLCSNFENIIHERQPFLSMDPETILAFNEIKPSLLKADYNDISLKKELAKDIGINDSDKNTDPTVIRTQFEPINEKTVRPLPVLVEKFGSKVYEHWKNRKIQANGNNIFPELKFERPDEKDDVNPYVCFRRRDVRHPRKTRRIDILNSHKLRMIHKALLNAKDLALLVAKRENTNLNLLQNEKKIFTERLELKKLKRSLNIKGEDDDLINHKRKKVHIITTQRREQMARQQREDEEKKILEAKLAADNAAAVEDVDEKTTKKNKTKSSKKESSTKAAAEKVPKIPAEKIPKPIPPQPQTVTSHVYVKLPSSKIPDIVLDDVENLLFNKERNARKFVHDRMEKRRLEDKHAYFNLTDDPYNPVFEIHIPKGVQSSNVPFSSITSSKFEIPKSYYSPDLHDCLNGSSKDIYAFKRNGEKISSKESYKIKKPEIYDPFATKNNQILTKEHPVMFRSRIGRCGIKYIDRKINTSVANSRESEAIFTEFFDFDAIEKQESNSNDVIDVYESKMDELVRSHDQWKYDSTFNEYGAKFSSEPATLNQISNETQVIRFGTMLGSKAYEQLRDITLKYRQEYINKLRQQKLNAKKLKANTPSVTISSNGNSNSIIAPNTQKNQQGSNKGAKNVSNSTDNNSSQNNDENKSKEKTNNKTTSDKTNKKSNTPSNPSTILPSTNDIASDNKSSSPSKSIGDESVLKSTVNNPLSSSPSKRKKSAGTGSKPSSKKASTSSPTKSQSNSTKSSPKKIQTNQTRAGSPTKSNKPKTIKEEKESETKRDQIPISPKKT
ncbi:hypothetical protein TBLA_0G03360 [Henningerozyma blattae CBS 6284]|uniref:Enhancer of polycomb-like protein n=1 Tax=Henningerozyma blattae (strain ATCC 34711 / CBS 6284 / DSM 70876 / NBRC 10599 / NRRL Y-10934 / UCD 77-7) TaxID=1071380 RepID=I2H7C1_HENB6|nr:hypothetical protein TBLA_0G03360 [Tetrapisispora blattae CBS 6284]CCH62273.1 hypothetical protein TBLA_0G03360 [Tetrapisispora blattae CBS 6284]